MTIGRHDNEIAVCRMTRSAGSQEISMTASYKGTSKQIRLGKEGLVLPEKNIAQ